MIEIHNSDMDNWKITTYISEKSQTEWTEKTINLTLPPFLEMFRNLSKEISITLIEESEETNE